MYKIFVYFLQQNTGIEVKKMPYVLRKAVTKSFLAEIKFIKCPCKTPGGTDCQVAGMNHQNTESVFIFSLKKCFVKALLNQALSTQTFFVDTFKTTAFSTRFDCLSTCKSNIESLKYKLLENSCQGEDILKTLASVQSCSTSRCYCSFSFERHQIVCAPVVDSQPEPILF